MDDQGSGSDENTREKAYIDKFCNIKDNAAQNELLCVTSKHVAQQNADINYTQTIDFPNTLNINLLDPEVTLEEENIFALLDQIFMNEAFPDVARGKTDLHNFEKPYLEMRSIVAMRSVAQNSFAHIIGEKTVGPEEAKVITPFMRSLLKDMGLNEESRNHYLGSTIGGKGEIVPVAPSYYAQMEILTKKTFQNPEFIANLYDKPANVKRIRAALTAIKLMQDRDIHNAMLRREMLTSMILELQVRHKQNTLGNKIEKIIANPPGVSDRTVFGDGAQNQFGVGTFNDNSGGGGF